MRNRFSDMLTDGACLATVIGPLPRKEVGRRGCEWVAYALGLDGEKKRTGKKLG
jgi:hypothetical protein